MNQIDRFQALIRHPDYRNDPRITDRTKFGGILPFISTIFPNYRSASWLTKWSREQLSYQDFLNVWSITHPVDPGNPKEIAAALEALRAGDDSIFKDDFRGYETYEYQGKPDTHPERYLTLAVDLERSTEELTEFFVAKVKKAKKERDIKRVQGKEYLADLWVVWDQMQLPGNTLSGVARVIDGTAGKRSIDPEVKASTERARRAYTQAVSMIDEVGRRRKTAATEEIMERQLAIHAPMIATIFDYLEKGEVPTEEMFSSAIQAWSPATAEDPNS